jgi:tRNA threonylcarbamoyladenosine biosynthesis protein TsaB
VLTVAIDASTYGGSVAVADGATLLAEREAAMRQERNEQLMPLVASAMEEACVRPRDIRRVVCGSGPGSFTSLRIGASIAKGLATGADCPLYAVPSALFIAAGARPALPPGRYLAAIDALRGEWFASLVEVNGGAVVSRGATSLVRRDELVRLASEFGAEIIGPGTSRNITPHARGLIALTRALDSAEPVDLLTWEPDYGRAAEAQSRWEAAHGRPLPRA